VRSSALPVALTDMYRPTLAIMGMSTVALELGNGSGYR
jgi:hypothetical protein